MPSITHAGPEGYKFQHLVTVWAALMLWENADLRVVPEEGEDFRVETDALRDGSVDVQVKSSAFPFSINSLAEILARFGQRQAEECTFDRMLAGERTLVVVGGSCTSDTERYRSRPGAFDGRTAVPPKAGRAFLTALAGAATEATDGSELDRNRRKHLVDRAKMPLAQARRALRRLSVWDRTEEAHVRALCVDMLRRLRVPVDHSEDVLDKLASAVEEAARGRTDALPALRKIVEVHRTDRRGDPNRISRADEQALFERLSRNHIVLLSGPPRCGKTEMGRFLLDQAADQGYLIKEYDSADDARLFLCQDGAQHRACLLDDPLGTRGVLKSSGQGLRELRGAVDATGSGRLLIIAQSRDELLAANSVDSLDRCRLPKASWQSLDDYPSGFLSAVWESYAHRHQVAEAKAGAVAALLQEGAHVEVGALEMVAANPDLLPDEPSRDDLWRAFRQEASDLTRHLVEQEGGALGDLMLVLAMTTTPHVPVKEREVAFVLGDAEDLPSLGLEFQTLSLLPDEEVPAPPTYVQEPRLDEAAEEQLDQLEQRRLICAAEGALQFRHAFYRAAAEWRAQGLPRRSRRSIPAQVRKALFSASPRTARATATNLPILYDLLNDDDARKRLLGMAAEGLKSRYPAVRDLCLRFLLAHQIETSEDEQEGLRGSGIYADRLFSFEWPEGEAWIPDRSSILTELRREKEPVSSQCVAEALSQLAAGPEAAPPPEDAARGVRYLKDHPGDLSAQMMENLLSYDLSAIRTEAAEAWLSLDREDDEQIRRRIFHDLAPAMSYRILRSLAKAWTGLPEARRQLLAADIAAAAEANPLAANAFMQTMSKFDRPHEFMAHPPWDLFAQTLPAAFRGLGHVQTFDSSNLWATLHNDALPHLSPQQIVQICTPWKDALEAWPDNKFYDYDFAGIVPILVKGTEDEPEARAEVSQKLLRTLNTPLQIVLLKDYLKQWDALTEAEKETIRDRLTGNHPEKVWYQAMALTQDEVPSDVQEWVTGDRQVLSLPPEDLRARLDPELFTACVHVHAGLLLPLPALGVSGNGRTTWRPVMNMLRTSSRDAHFMLALEEALYRRDEKAVTAAVEAADASRLDEVFNLMLSHEIGYSGDWMPAAWDALLARASTPVVRNQWLDRMAEVAPGFIENVHDLSAWVNDKAMRDALLKRLPADGAILVILAGVRQLEQPEEEIIQAFMGIVEHFVDRQPPRIMGVYSVLQNAIREIAPHAAPLLEKLEQRRREAVAEWARLRDEGRPPHRIVEAWTRPPRADE